MNIIKQIEMQLKDCRKEYLKASKKDDEYDMEYWDGRINAYEDVLTMLKK